MTISNMSDRELLRQFQSGTLDLTQFDHGAHVRLAYVCLDHYDFWQGTLVIGKGLNALATAAGHADKYHETVTAAYMAIINQRRHEQPENSTWASFISANPDLLEPGLLENYYTKDILKSNLAKDVFVLPKHRAA